jgi:hypothetical protein
MAAIQEISARIGRVTGFGIARNLRRHYPAWLSGGTVLLLLSSNLINLGADLGAVGVQLKSRRLKTNRAPAPHFFSNSNLPWFWMRVAMKRPNTPSSPGNATSIRTLCSSTSIVLVTVCANATIRTCAPLFVHCSSTDDT